MNVIALLDEAAARSPDAIALVWVSPRGEQTLRFDAFADASRRLAGLFHARGLRAGDAVVVFLPMGGMLYQVTAAALRLGLVPVFVDPAHWRATLERAVAALPVRAFVGTPLACMVRWALPVLRRIPLGFVDGPTLPRALSLAAAGRCAPHDDIVDCRDDALALVGFTSGTSGTPKGVLRSHGVLRGTYDALVRHLALRPGEVHLATQPLFVLANLGAGVTSVIAPIALQRPADTDAAAVLQLLRRWPVSGVVGSPRLLLRVAEHGLRERQRLASVRHVFVGGAPVLPATVATLADAMPNASVAAVYGATEAEPIALDLATARDPAVLRAIATGAGLPAGRPVAGLSVAVLQDRWGTPREPCTAAEFAALRLPPGVPGEILVSGPNVSPAYLDTADNGQGKLVVDGTVWHRTGDAGVLDAAGALWLVGRGGRGLRCGERTIYPLQVEAALAGLPHVAGGTLVAVQGRRVLVLQPAAGFGDVDLQAATERLAWCEADEIVLVSRLPLDRRHQAKIRYADLVADLERGRWLRREALPLGPLG